MTNNSNKIRRVCTACGKVSYYGRKDKPKVCPFCYDVYWDKPKDERDLFLLQNEYLLSNYDSKILGKMYEKFVAYSENIVKKSLKGSGKLLSREDLTEKSESIAIKLVERYLKTPGSIVENSFGGMLKLISRGVLYAEKVKRVDKETSLEKQIDEDFVMLDNPAYFIKDPVAKRDFETKYELDAHDELAQQTACAISQELMQLINGMTNRIRNSQDSDNSFYFLIGLKNFLDPKKVVEMDQYYDFCKNQDRVNIENAKLIIRKYLLDRMRT